MTTPDLLDGLGMPFSIPMTPAEGTGWFTIPPPFRNSAATASLRVALPLGVSMVKLTWDGPESIQAMFGRTAGSIRWRPLMTLDAAPAGTPRFSIAEISLDDDAWILVAGKTPVSASTVEDGWRAGITVIPTPTV